MALEKSAIDKAQEFKPVLKDLNFYPSVSGPMTKNES